MLEYIERSKLYERYKVVDADYRLHVVNINLEIYFNKEFLEWSNISKRILNPNKRIYQEKFQENIEKLLDSMWIEKTISEIKDNKLIWETMEIINKDITFIFNRVRKNQRTEKKYTIFEEKVKKKWEDTILE